MFKISENVITTNNLPNATRKPTRRLAETLMDKETIQRNNTRIEKKFGIKKAVPRPKFGTKK